MPKSHNKMSKQIFVYVCDWDQNGNPIFALVTNIEEIPDDQAGQKIGLYSLTGIKTMRVTRQLLT